MEMKFSVLIAFLLTLTLLSGAFPDEQCQRKGESPVDFDSVSIYPTFNFKAEWTYLGKHFWKSREFDFESRYLKSHSPLPIPIRGNNRTRESPRYRSHPTQHVEVFVLPYSHNDPGWKDTFEGYYYSLTRKILNNSITKLTEFTNMTFAWSEVVFLQKWWDESSSAQKESLRQLVRDGRFEILTGGWVMPDEATTTLFSLVNQLVEGHQWLYQNLNISPKVAWSIDPFGHSSTMPYILKKAGIEGMMIQRIHYNWKHWLAEHRNGDFLWFPRWSTDPKNAIICHNAHYDLYPTKHSCGPNPFTCMGFDFRRIPGTREEHHLFVNPVNEKTLPGLSESLVSQYRRTASLTRHNLVLTALGGDFRFEEAMEWDQQHDNYQRLFSYINANFVKYNTTANFGTLSNYFQKIQDKGIQLPSFKGDFFPYSDVIFAFSPAYWTGFYGTRPYWKKLNREAEDELLKAEILFTFSYNLMRQRNHSSAEILFRNYDNLVLARRSIALFQHHDGITGTSPRTTMLDYAKKLTQAWNFCQQIQKLSIEIIWRNELQIRMPRLLAERTTIGSPGLVGNRPVKLFQIKTIVKKVVMFNSLGWKRSELVRVLVEDPRVIVKGTNGEIIPAQVNPKLERRSSSGHQNRKLYELLFVSELPPLSIITYEIRRYHKDDKESQLRTITANVSCSKCEDSTFNQVPRNQNITFENQHMKAHFNGDTGLLTKIESKLNRTVGADVKLSFGRYDSNLGSGAYLMQPVTSTSHPIFDRYNIRLYVIEGPIMSELVLITETMRFSTWLVHKGSPELTTAVFMSNEFNETTDVFGEYFMRVQTDLINANNDTQQHPHNKNETLTNTEKSSPIFFIDTNGLAVEKRVTVKKLPYQASHYPVTNFVYIQDPSKGLRLTLAVDRAHGVSSVELGRLEVIFDRRLRYDDARGMGEGVLDSEVAVSNYALKLESLPGLQGSSFHGWEPSLEVQRLSKFINSQPTIFTYDALDQDPNERISIFSGELPEDLYLLNLRTISGSTRQGMSLPSGEALMILQRLGHLETQRKSTCTRDNVYNQTRSRFRTRRMIPKLGSSLTLNHSLDRTNLVGTAGTKASSTNRFVGIRDTKYLPLGEPYELHSYLVNFHWNKDQ